MSFSRVAVEFSYDGGSFFGYARQNDQITVQGTIEAALETLFGVPIDTVVAGRTDRGVHADSQFLSFDNPFSRDLDEVRIRRSLDRLCGDAIAVRRVHFVDDRFHARFSAVARRYRYVFASEGALAPYERHLAWEVSGYIDYGALHEASKSICGERNFAAFCRKDPNGGSLWRRVDEVSLYLREGGRYAIEIEANAFCHQMIRSLVAYLIAIGSGKLAADSFARLFDLQSRANGIDLAPPSPLSLVAVRYPEPYGEISSSYSSLGELLWCVRDANGG
ncbi:MAG: tRNA pseudouridine(38-40) synthase TruA [Actinomycetota bacterium]|nr:tRNA pseudouridine(38-40) synthase TruA [Actinomycetota bacterium]